MQPAEHAQSAAQARDGQGHAPQLLQETHQNFKVIRQPQKLSKEQSSGIQQKHFHQKKATE